MLVLLSVFVVAFPLVYRGMREIGGLSELGPKEAGPPLACP